MKKWSKPKITNIITEFNSEGCNTCNCYDGPGGRTLCFRTDCDGPCFVGE
ncbi:hypothetical protein [Candidatus Lokiarchaeum ossiferum]